MKLKSAVKYRYKKIFKISAIFYILMLELVIGSFIIRAVTKSNYALDNFFPYIMYGFTFGIGAASYSKELNLFLQNGVSRQHIHLSFLVLLPINLAFAVISVLDDLMFWLVDRASNPLVDYYSTHAFHFIVFKYPESLALKILIDIVLVTLCYATLMSYGYMAGAIIRSMRTFYKVIVCVIIVVIGALLYVINQVDNTIIEELFLTLRAFLGGNCYAEYGYVSNFIVALIICISICVAIAHLLIRKATLKRGGDQK